MLSYCKGDSEKIINKGELILYHDGEKVKLARAVNSLVTTTQDKVSLGTSIKILDVIEEVTLILII